MLTYTGGKDSDSIGMDKSLKEFSKPTQAVLQLSKAIFNTNRYITANNWFTSMELKKKGLTWLELLMKKKREIFKSSI